MILYDVRASRAVPDTVASVGGTSHVNRVGHAFFKIGHARARRRLRRRGLRPLLLPRLLVRRLRDDPGAARARAALDRGRGRCRSWSTPFASATSSPARSTPRSPTSRRRCGRSPSATPTARSPGSTASRSTTRTGTSTSALEHGAAPAPQPRVARLARGHGAQAGRGAGTDPLVTPEDEALERARRGGDPPAARSRRRSPSAGSTAT